MTIDRWRTAYASVIGTSHVKTGSPCQDACGCMVLSAHGDQEILLAVVSDGAGTAPKSEEGSTLAVQCFLRSFAEVAMADPDLSSINRTFVQSWLASTKQAIANLAEQESRPIADYACTILGAIIGPRSAAYLQIGDGAIVVAKEEPGEYAWIFWPQHGEYANSTYFITQDFAEDALMFDIGAPVSEIAVFSDGIERLVLDMSNKAVHSPAFKPIFDWLAKTQPDRTNIPSLAISAYLASDHVNGRTDDDKSLVIATRSSQSGPTP